MRDKERIPIILDEIRRIWEDNPDLRLGQIVTLASRPKNPCPEIFYIEDQDVLEGLESIGYNKKESFRQHERKPYWEIYPDIIRINLDELTYELVELFIGTVGNEQPDLIITPRSLMKLVGAPVGDTNWLISQTDRIEKLRSILKELEKRGLIKVAEIGYRIK